MLSLNFDADVFFWAGHVLTDQDISGHRHLYVGFHLPGKRSGHGHKDPKDGSGKDGENQKNG